MATLKPLTRDQLARFLGRNEEAIRRFETLFNTLNLVPVENGGTGLDTVSQGDMLYGSATDEYALLSKSATDSYIGNGGTDNNPAWAAKAALSRVDDTNITLKLSGGASTALLSATTITAGWNGQLSMARGGSGKALTASNGGVVYTDADSMEVLSGTATAGQVLRSGATAAPSWSTATYPNTVTVNQVLYGTSTNTVGGSASLTFDGTTLSTPRIAVADGTTLIATFVNTAASGPSGGAGLIGRAEDGAALVTGDRLGFLLFGGSFSATQSFNAAGIVSFATANWSAANKSANLVFETTNAGTRAERWRITPAGRLSNTGADGTAWVEIRAGSTAANAAPLKFNSGSDMTTAEVGAMEFSGNRLKFTEDGPTRRFVVQAASATHTTAGAPYTNNGYVEMVIDGTTFKLMTTAG